MLFYERWSNNKMSCDQWAVDRTLQTKWKESPQTDPVGFRPPGQGHHSTKSTLSLSATPRGLLHGPCSPQQHQATKSTSPICIWEKVNNTHSIQTFNCGKWLNGKKDLTGLHQAIISPFFFYNSTLFKFTFKSYCVSWLRSIIRPYLVSVLLLYFAV